MKKCLRVLLTFQTQIRCNSIHPGVVETDMIRAVIDRSPDPAAARAQFEGMAPMGRMAQVQEVAALVAYARAQGAPELIVPKKILKVHEVPVLGTGKTDYVAIQRMAEREALAA